MKFFILCFILLMSGCSNLSAFFEYEHISSLPNGRPFNSKSETSTDIFFGGLRYRQNGWIVDGGLGQELSSDLVGDNPFARFRVGKEVSLSKKK